MCNSLKFRQIHLVSWGQHQYFVGLGLRGQGEIFAYSCPAQMLAELAVAGAVRIFLSEFLPQQLAGYAYAF